MTAQPVDLIEVTEVPVEVADPHRFLDVLEGERALAFPQGPCNKLRAPSRRATGVEHQLDRQRWRRR